ncbi:hypothetical protein OHB37_31115 (plasmid) [Streptomyces albidoflavus]|uniref:hypothetical protein n=1 Tax=Streptomyces albidoflavus TaxID=1886 RepID=UPI002ED1A87B|nr:hypothetical protein OHB37_31115 [Streptomyces albidoflavus]
MAATPEPDEAHATHFHRILIGLGAELVLSPLDRDTHTRIREVLDSAGLQRALAALVALEARTESEQKARIAKLVGHTLRGER